MKPFNHYFPTLEDMFRTPEEAERVIMTYNEECQAGLRKHPKKELAEEMKTWDFNK